MRIPALAILTIATALTAAPARAQTYDPAYLVCNRTKAAQRLAGSGKFRLSVPTGISAFLLLSLTNPLGQLGQLLPLGQLGQLGIFCRQLHRED